MTNLRQNKARTAIGAVLAGIALAFGPAHAPAQAAGNPVTGQALYQAKCGGCHSLDANRIGPAHRGVVGRRIATAPGFAYSLAIKKLPGVWTAALLDKWLQGPQKLAPGSKMFLTIPDADQRADIVAYLVANASSAPARKAK
ncbi:c-type cytochrome [Novosphingobium sp.]|uniref:c-type cytochrome n=1 Tax=Novosphingobium sp. TaxID=1874826 RepID=UPI0025FE824F|nr:c-type cytochrome [Novosphingobium sp.]